MLPISNLQKVVQFHTVFQHPVRTVLYDTVMTDEKKLVVARFNLIAEEVNELQNAINTNNFTEIVDAICDIAYVVFGSYIALGIDEQKLFDDYHCNKTTTKWKLGDTEYEKVGTSFSESGMTVFTKPNKNVFDDLTDLNKKMVVINDNMVLLQKAIDNDNLTDFGNVLTVLLYTVYEISYCIGINFDDCFAIVHNSNMSKGCSTEDEAKESVQYILLTKKEYTPSYKLSNDNKYYIIYDTVSGKILKNKYYTTVDFSSLF
jgi:predicted HAD superfamily Cof-like phosphohydrolase